MLDGDLTQDGVAVVGHDDAAHRVHEHLEHGLGPQARANHVRHCLGCHDVADLDFFALFAFGVAT